MIQCPSSYKLDSSFGIVRKSVPVSQIGQLLMGYLWQLKQTAGILRDNLGQACLDKADLDMKCMSCILLHTSDSYRNMPNKCLH